MPAHCWISVHARRAEAAQIGADQLRVASALASVGAGPIQSDASAKRSARRRSQVPEGGTRTSEPGVDPGDPRGAEGDEPPGAAFARRAGRQTAAAPAARRRPSPWRRPSRGACVSHCSRRSSVTAAANVHQSLGVRRWIVERSEVPWTSVRRTSARSSCSRSKPSSLVQRPTYIEGAYCAWMPAIRSTAFGSGRRRRVEQELAVEERAVQLGLAEGALGLAHAGHRSPSAISIRLSAGSWK